MRRTGLERQVAEFIDDQQSGFAEVGEAILEPALAMRFGELGHQVGAGTNSTVVARPVSLGAADRHRQMGLADAGRGRDMVPDTRGRTRRFTTLFIRIVGGELQLCGVIRSAASRCW